MKPIGKALLELRSTLFGIGMFNSLLDSFIVLLAGILILALLKLPWWIAFIPFVIYFVWHTRTMLGRVGYGDVEKRVPQLHEALRTAADSVENDNEVVKALHTEVLDKMRLVQTSAFIGFGRTTRQLLIIAALCFGVIFVSALGVHFLDGTAILGKAGVAVGNFDAQRFLAKLTQDDPNAKPFQQEIDLIDNTELYGNASVIELGTEELNLELNPDGSGIKIGDVRDAENKNFDENGPSEIEASTDTAFTEDIPKEYQGIVRNYFKNIPR